MEHDRYIASRRLLSVFLVTATAATLLLLAGCKVKVDEKKEGKNKNVDITTPFGDLKVRNDADAKDTGLSVFPNSRLKPGDNQDDSKSANVNMSFGKFGLKVAVATYETDASPDKVLAYYRTEIGKYGKVLECKGGSIGNVNIEHDDKDKDKELRCEHHGDSNVTELKVGSRDLQHVVAVKPSGNGTEFSLVYVRTSGDNQEPI
ncbi:MAG TPA: hypothetical protein VF135_10700 [Terriglobales bacterium]